MGKLRSKREQFLRDCRAAGLGIASNAAGDAIYAERHKDGRAVRAIYLAPNGYGAPFGTAVTTTTPTRVYDEMRKHLGLPVKD